MKESLYPFYPVLIVDDQMSSLRTMEELLKEWGITNVLLCDDSRHVQRLLTNEPVSLILLDLLMPHLSGEDLIPLLRQQVPETPIIVITAAEDVERAVRCMKKGVYDYFIKNKADERLQAVLRKALEITELKFVQKKLEQKILSPHIERPELFSGIVTRHPGMLSIFEYIEAIAPSSETVLITGETGTGKELIARQIHEASGRRGEFVAVNVAALEDTQFSDTLFGHAPGAFTDAKNSRKGLVELAQGGTLFIDEIADVNPDIQQKLLRLLEEKEYRPLGVDHPRISNARIIAATNKDLHKLIKMEKFRHDLYYRLHIHMIHLPPLRERSEDIPLLTDFFIGEIARENHKTRPQVPVDVYEALSLYPYPGNVRELRAVISDAVIANRTGSLAAEYFKDRLVLREEHASTDFVKKTEPEQVIFPRALPTLKQLKKILFTEALRRTNGNNKMAAQLLGISRQAFTKRSHAASPMTAQIAGDARD